MSTENALILAVVLGKEDGSYTSSALAALAAEVRRLQSKNATLREALLTIYGGLPYVVTEAKDIASRALEETK